MSEITIEPQDPPEELLSDLREIRQSVDIEEIVVEDGPDDDWTMRITGDNDRDTFSDKANLVKSVTSNYTDAKCVYERKTSTDWLVLLTYDIS